MQSEKRARHRLDWRAASPLGFILIALILGAAFVYHLTLRPMPVVASEPFLIGVVSSQAVGELRLEVNPEKDIDLESDGPIKIRITLAGNVPSTATLFLVGVAAERLESCEGAEVGSLAHRLNDDDLDEVLVRYAQRRPGTGALFGITGRDVMSRVKAEGVVSKLASRSAVVELTTPAAEPEDELGVPAESNERVVTKIVCDFNRSAFVERSDRASTFRSPDLVVGAMNDAGTKRTRACYWFRLKEVDRYSWFNQSFLEATEFVEAKQSEEGCEKPAPREDGLFEVSRAVAQSSTAGQNAILVTGGAVSVEGVDAEQGRLWANLILGLLISFVGALLFPFFRRLIPTL